MNPLDVFVKGNVFGYLAPDSIKRLVSNSWPFKPVSKTDFLQLKKFAAVNCTDMTAEEIEGNPELIKLAQELVDSFPRVLVNLNASLHNAEMLKHAGFDPYGCEKVAALELDSHKTNIVLCHFGKPDESLTLGQAAERFGVEKVAQIIHDGQAFTIMSDIMCKIAEEDNQNQFKFDTNYPKTVNMADGLGSFVRGNIYELRDIKNPNTKIGHIFLSTRSKDPYYSTLFNAPARDRIYSLAERNLLFDVVDDLSRSSGSKGQALGILMNNVVYGPFELLVEAKNGTNHILSIKDGYEYETKRIHLTNDVKTIVVDDDEIYVPNNIAKVIYLGEPYNKPNSINKLAAVNVAVSASPDRSSFNVTDNGVSGLPSGSLQNIQKTKAVAALMHCGLSKEEAQSAIETARSTGIHNFKATPTATQSENTVRQEVESPAEKRKLEKTAFMIQEIVYKSNLIKISMNYCDE